MDNKEAIIQAAVALINEKGEQMNEITVREICKKANVGLGLVNYHFGNKDKLIELCVKRMISGIVDNFQYIREQTDTGLTPFKKLETLGEMTLTFLFEHDAVSKISILTDMSMPKEDDNTRRTYLAYLPLVSACCPDWDEMTVKRKTFCLIATMQQIFLRHKEILQLQGIDLTDKEKRRLFHAQVLHDILEI
ncbi:TetR/AcrR family transcriptional regulator [Eubacterium sp. 1001713B170207_170306_E7]|uniref:TetR/AcrR family transcriptional regulator n=1 Tax=Eubacterium sp. 1001713B170207_170306_E7 TaxID=2787097 RepID=UPI0018974025|nr:TetR/AcrR family transcriptional regulator [Eubacterium sp. 1001713B170207_170306_E7]